MAIFTNYATLSYNGGSTDSNTVTGELLETLSAVKTAVGGSYEKDGTVTYAISLTNTGSTALGGISVSDNMGAYAIGTATLYPLLYEADSVTLYINGVLSATPTVTSGPPTVFSGISVPAGGNAVLIYKAKVTEYAPLATGSSVTNTASIGGGGLATPIAATETVTVTSGASLAISKAISPSTVSENDRLSYTFVIANSGNVAADATENIVLGDTFDPVLSDITVTLNGTALTAGTQYTYDGTTGVFSTVAGVITVPSATFTQSADGAWVTAPGTATVVITGTV